ncbi:hypothetical protein [Streptosporangium sp. H16]|uniref:hypothetical protein n=1 Tax=Streptosporangium sp. H16 TaxID=3444184 RepID=UPI003F79419B
MSVPRRSRVPRGRRIPYLGRGVPESDSVPTGDPLQPAPRYARRRRALLGALALTLVTLLFLPFLIGSDEPITLGDSELRNDRLTHGPVCLDLAVDYSSSMTEEAPIRDAALAELRTFIDRNLDPGDVLASVAFTDQARLVLPPTSQSALAGVSITADGPPNGKDTRLLPALAELNRAYAARDGACAAHALIMITDVQLADSAPEVRDALTGMRLQRAYWAVPGGDDDDRPGLAGSPELASVVSRGFDDARGLSLLYGRALATLTGQELVRR